MLYNVNLSESEWEQWYERAIVRQNEINAMQKQLDNEFRQMYVARQISRTKEYAEEHGWKHGDSIRLSKRFVDKYNENKEDYFSRLGCKRGNFYLLLVSPDSQMYEKCFYNPNPIINFAVFKEHFAYHQYVGNIMRGEKTAIENIEPSQLISVELKSLKKNRYCVKKRLRKSRYQRKVKCLQNPF